MLLKTVLMSSATLCGMLILTACSPTTRALSALDRTHCESAQFYWERADSFEEFRSWPVERQIRERKRLAAWIAANCDAVLGAGK